MGGQVERNTLYSDSNGRIYEAIGQLQATGIPVDITTVASTLRDRGWLQQIGGPSYLAQLADATPAVSHVEAHARIVREKARLRTTIATCQRVAAEGYGDVGDSQKFLDGATAALAAIRDDSKHGDAGFVLGVRPLDIDALFAPLPPVDWISRDLQWCAGRPAVIVGSGGSGKTMAVQSAAVALASGERPIWGHFSISRRCRVLHLDLDNGTNATRRRYQRLAFGMALPMEALRGFLRVVPYPTVRLTDQRARDAYRRAVEGYDVCFLDSLRGATPGVDENDARIRDVFDQILAPVSEATGCAFVVLHHEGKGSAQKPDHEAGRGSSGIFDGSGSQLRLMQEKDADGNDLRRVRMSKASTDGAGKDLDPFFLAFEDVPDDEGHDLKAGVRVLYRNDAQGRVESIRSPKLGEVRRKVLEYIREQTTAGKPVPGTEALAQGVALNRTAVRTTLAELEDDRLVENAPERVGRGEAKPRLWALPAEDYKPPHRAG